MPAMTFESVLGKATRPTGCGVLVVRDGRILTGTRKEKASRGQICGPGGHIEPGETPKEAARREAYEEFGIICEDLKPLGVQNGGRHGRSAVFLCNKFRGTPKTDEEEMTDPEWLTINEIKEKNVFKPFEQSLELLLREKVLKFNPYHSPSDGKFTSGPGGGGLGGSDTSARQKEIDSLKQEFANTKGLIARSKIKNKIEALENGYDDVEEWKKVKSERQQAKIAESKARQEAKEKAEKEKEAERKEAERKEIEREMQTQPKQKVDQFKIIQENNPMLDDYHVGIRKPSDIKTWKEVIDSDDGSGESFAWGDFSQKDAKAALKSGKITIYSSYPINQGVFVSTSKVQAEEYAGGKGNKVYSKTVPLDDVAWINGDEGQFAKVSAVRKSATFNEILKFNPNHDHLGRFSSGPGGGSAVSDMKISTFSTGASGDEVYMRSEMKDGDKLAGYVEYSVYNDVPAIQYIHTEDDFKRQGVATKLMQDLQRQYPDKEIEFGMTTPDGTKFLDSITYEVKNEKVAAQKKELQSLKDEMTRNEAELNRLYDKMDNDMLSEAENKKLDKLGERWDELNDGIRNLEDDLWNKKETMRFVRLDDTKKSITGGENMSKDFTIFKADEDKRLVFGWASISVTIDGQELEDRQHDIIDPEELEEAAYEYVLDFRDAGEEHIETMRKRGRLIESCVFTKEKQRAIGIPEGSIPIGWWVGFKIDDDAAWQRVKSGMYKMFSIEGRANRKPIEKSTEAKTFDEILKFNPFHDHLGRFASSNSFRTYSANPKTKAGAMAISRSAQAGHRSTANVHRESKGEDIGQNYRWLETGKKPSKLDPSEPVKPRGPRYKDPSNPDNKKPDTPDQPTTTTKPGVVNGKDIANKFNADDYRSAVEQVAEAQGYKGKPRVVSQAEFDAAVKETGSIGYRTITPGKDVVTGKDQTSKQFADTLMYGDEKSFSLNGSGGQVYGGGLYVAMNRNPVSGITPSGRDAHSAESDSKMYGWSGHKNATVSITYDPSSKIGDFNAVSDAFDGLSRSEKARFNYDVGAYAAAKGYDGLRSKDAGWGCDYVIMYNRTKLIMLDNVDSWS